MELSMAVVEENTEQHWNESQEHLQQTSINKSKQLLLQSAGESPTFAGYKVVCSR